MKICSAIHTTNKKILALDLGRRTGWAVYAPGITEDHRDSGVYEVYKDLPSNKSQPDMDDAQRFISLSRFLASIDHAFGGFDYISFEAVAGGTKGRQTTLWNGYRAIVMHYCGIAGKPCFEIPVGTVKKVFTGNGAAKKDEMILTCRAMGYAPFDDNEADAIAVLHATVRLSGTPELDQHLTRATPVDTASFKIEQKIVLPGKKRRSKDATNSFTLLRQSSINVAETRIKEGPTCETVSSLDSQASAPAAKRRRQESQSNTSDSKGLNSRKRSNTASAKHSA